MAKKKQSYAELISEAQVMLAGLKNNSEEVAKRGASAEFTANLEKARALAITLNDEQERLKADLKEKTNQLQTQMDAIVAMLSESRKVVKLALPQTRWKEFGIDDKK